MRLYSYQEKYLASLPSSCIMAADTGTGKTLMSLAHAKNLPILVLAPASKVRTGDWEREAEEFGLTQPITVVSYEKATRTRTIERQLIDKQRRYWWEEWLDNTPEFVLICDEVHKAKNPQSLVGKGVFVLATHPSCRQFIGLSATPLPNGWQDAGNYGKIFGWWKHKTEFWNRHIVTYQIPGQHWSKISGYKDEERLRELWASVAKPLRKEEALDLPKLSFKSEKFTKPKIYDTVRKTRIYQAEELDNAPKLANALRRTLIDERIKWLADFLDGASGHTVVFYQFIEEREKILSVTPGDVTVYRQDGEQHEVPLKQDWDKLPSRSITVMQYQSGSVGIECTYADKIVYLSPTYSYADFSQSIGRVYRNGQKLPVTAYLLHTPDTIDAAIWSCIKRKQTFDYLLWYNENNEMY